MSKTKSLAATLGTFPLFAGVSHAALEQMCEEASVQEFAAGMVLMEGGHLGSECYVILRGSVEVDLPDGAKRTVGTGYTVGEMALLDYNRRSATVRVLEPLEALVVHASDFGQLMLDFPDFRARILEEAAQRPRVRRPAPEPL